uniref:Variant surface glycoprotein 1125.158 n=1 Tax=Trypanosoma brucei TaxID=5691 RepID=M4SWX3_9TRYP|nr:variant surface glycoprotein 372 [Trypanosoma brucei]APD73009.1 variant surface glycoprotein 1125.158 [Trypanosoma brucei]
MPQISRCSRHQLTVAALSLVFSNLARGATTNGVNAPAYATLCDIYNLKDAKPPTVWAKQFDDAQSLITAIYNLNISTASDTWLTNKDGEFANISDSAERDRQLKEWIKQVEATTAADTTTGKPGPYSKVPNNPFKPIANKQIDALYRQAQTKKGAFEQAKKEVTEAHTKANRKILDAIYGTGKSAFDTTAFTTTKQQMCGNGNNGHANVGKNILNDMICLCTAEGSQSDKACGEKDMGEVQSDATGAEAAAANLEGACTKKETKQELSEALIQSKVAAFFAHVGAIPDSQTDTSVRFVLGQAQSTGCKGSSDAQCVNYKAQLTTGGGGIPWVNQLEEAASILRRASIAYAEAAHIDAELKSLKAQAASLRNAAVIGIALPNGAEAAARLNDHKELSESAEQACNKLNSEQKCSADPKCSYETESDGTKKCKYNATKAKEKGVSVTQTQTGGSTAEGVKCSDHKDQATCEKANEGKTTKVCGWRSGKDNEDEKKKVKCLDSIFLLNKQFALSVVSAAFVALLF